MCSRDCWHITYSGLQLIIPIIIKIIHTLTVQPYCRPGMYNALGHSLEHCPRFLTAVYGPYFSSIVAGLPLSTAIRYRLGGPLHPANYHWNTVNSTMGDQSLLISSIIATNPKVQEQATYRIILVPWIEIYVLRTRSPLMYFISHSFDSACVQRTSRLR
jgi:hypothetical protein